MAADIPKVVRIERGLVLALDIAVSAKQILGLMFEGGRVGVPVDDDARKCAENCIAHFDAVINEVKQLKAKRVLADAQPQGPKH